MIPRRTLTTAVASLAGLALIVSGCGKPNRANIELRKQNTSLQSDLDVVKRQREADRLTIEALQKQQNSGVPTLPPARLEKLFTTHGIALGRLTGGADLDPSKPGDEGLKVYVGLFDQSGQKFKAAGSFAVEAFDLAMPPGQDNRLGKWTFDVGQAKDLWNGLLLQYGYVLTCPWQRPPAHPDVTVKVTFRDELTGREFVQQGQAKVNPPPAAPTPPPQSPQESAEAGH